MKYIVYILLVFLGITAKAQLPASTFMSRDFNGNTKADWIILDSPLVNFVGTTTFNARYAGTQFVKIGGGDTAFYFGAGGTLWFRTLLDRDTISLSNRINLKLNISDTVGQWLAQSTRLVDSMYRVNDSTVGYTIKGNPYTFQILGRLPSGGGGSGTVTSVALSMPSAFTVTGSPITTSGTFSVSGAGTTAEYIRGNGTLATTDTGMIPNFHLKVRSLFSVTSPLTYNSTTGIFGVGDANTAGTKGVATFASSAFTDNGSGLINLVDVTTAGGCINCDITFDAKGRAISFASGTPPQFVNAPGAGDTLSRSDTLKRLNPGYGILHTVNDNNITQRVDTGATGLATQFDLTLVNNGLSRRGDTTQLGSINTTNNPLNHDTWINTGAFKLTVQGSTGSGNVFEAINLGSGTGVFGQSVSEYGVLGSSSSLYGVYGTSTTSNAIRGWTTNGNTAAYFEGTASSTNTVIPTVQIKRTTSGSAAAGIGSSIEYYIEKDNGANNTVSNSLRSLLTTATSGGEVSQFEIYGVNAATLARKAALAGNGQWTWDGYPALTAQVDSTTYKPVAIDGSGNVVKMSGWAGSGGGATLNNIGSGYRWVATSGGNIKTSFAGYGVLKDSSSNANGITDKVDTSALKSVYLPLTLNSSKIINQATNNITFTGGGQLVSDSVRLTQTYTNPTLLSDSLVTFGNSITAGLNASVQDSAYVNRVSSYSGLPLTNKGVSSTVAYQACASNLTYINPGHAAMVTFCIGLNDYRNNGGGANMYRGVKNAYEAAMVNQFLSSYTAASNCTVTGSWTTNYNAVTNAGGKTTAAAYSSTLNDSITNDIVGTSVAIGIIGQYSSARSADIYIDGVLMENVITDNQTFAAGTGYQSMGKYYTGLSSGTHHVKVVVGAGSGFLLVDYIGTMVSTASMQPFVIMHVPHMDATGYAGGNATQAIIDAGNDSLTAIYTRAFAAGLNVYLAQTNTYYNASTSSGLSSDHIHPNNLGMYQIFTSIRYGLSAAVATPGTIRYSNDDHFYGTKLDGSLNQIPYTQDLNFQRVLSNGGNLLNPNTVTSTNTFDWLGFSRFRINDFFIDNTHAAVMHGVLAVQGPNGTIAVLNRSGDTTKGFLLYTDSDLFRETDQFNNKDVTVRDTSFRKLFKNNGINNILSLPTATIHVGGNDGGRVGHASMKIDSGALMSSPEKYAIEVDGDSIYWTNRLLIRVALNRIGSAVTTLYTGDGTLGADRNIASGGFTLRLTGANNSDTLMSIINTGTSSTGLFSLGSLYGVDAQGTTIGLRAFGSATGLTAEGGTSEGAVIKSDAIRGATIQSVPATTNTVQEVVRFERGSTGGPGANGIGGSADFYNKLSDNSSNVSNQIISKWTNATVGSRTSQFKITGVNSTTTGDVLTIDGDGSFTTYGKRIVGTTTSSAGTLTLGNSEAYIFNGTTTTWTLPAVSGTTGTIYYIKNIGSGSVTLNAAAAANEIYSTSAVNTYEITAGSAIILISNNTYWTVN